MKEILKRIKRIVEEDEDLFDFPKPKFLIAFSGIKRLIYGIWNDGFNEKEENMIVHMSENATDLYYSLISDYKNTPKIEVHISSKKSKIEVKNEDLGNQIFQQDDEIFSDKNEMLGVQTNDIILWLDDDWSVSLDCSHVNGQDTNGRDEVWCYFNDTLLCT